jgi:hypothetical protein
MGVAMWHAGQNEKPLQTALPITHCTLKWVPVSFDAIATIRFLGEYTLAGLNVPSSESQSTVPK